MIKPHHKHIALAYLLLIITVWLVWAVGIKPLKVRWDSHRATSIQLQSKIDLIQRNRNEAQQNQARTRQEIIAMIRAGKLSLLSQPNEAAHQLQTRAKQAFINSAASLSQLRPSTVTQSDGLQQSRLEVNFHIAADKLEQLLSSLAMQKPALSLDLLILRKSPFETSHGKPHELEATAIVSMWFINDDIQQILGSIEQTNHHQQAKLRPIVSKLAGLFDADYRQRRQNPGPQNYRLSAVTVSENARVAVITNSFTGSTERFTEGDQLDGWIIESISQNSVTIMLAERREQLFLPKTLSK